MLFRMIMHSAVFTFLIAVGAVVLNGTNLLGGGPSWSNDTYNSRAMWQSNDHHDNRWGHDDD
ncbi:MAG: hypothetical protein COB59_08200 [Rhodospirillaceae bacterium]|nr:MAG: hypothetical protein COB59_08200 [Rhodospirillaceae bacterium]